MSDEKNNNPNIDDDEQIDSNQNNLHDADSVKHDAGKNASHDALSHIESLENKNHLSDAEKAEREYNSKYAKNQLFIHLLHMPLESQLKLAVNGRLYPIWKLSVIQNIKHAGNKDNIIYAYTNPISAYPKAAMDGICMPCEVSNGIAATVEYHNVSSIIAVMPDDSMVEVSADNFIAYDADTDQLTD